MTQETVQEILAGAEELAPPQSVPPNLQPRVTRQGPKGRTARSADPLSLDESSTDSPTSTRGRGTRGKATPRDTPTALPDDAEALDVEGQLAVILMLAGGVVGMALPVTGMTLTLRAKVGAHAIIEVARTNPKSWKRLTSLLKASKYAELAQVTASVVTALAVDLHMVNPQSFMPQNTIPDVLELFRTETQATPTEPNGHTPNEPTYASELFHSNGGPDV